jgi:Raf kinase inhibitor-like YbhB/YbcL family protein
MLQHLPPGVGHALKDFRAGLETTTYHQADFAGAPEAITVSSSAFTDGGRLPVRYTADGDKLSPPLAWTGVPEGAAVVVLIVEDADAPMPSPVVHTLAWALPPERTSLHEGALRSSGSGGEPLSLGLNSFFGAEYLPPDPLPGHGPHRYLFQLFALDAPPAVKGTPLRAQLVAAMKGHVMARGLLVGVYERA